MSLQKPRAVMPEVSDNTLQQAEGLSIGVVFTSDGS